MTERRLTRVERAAHTAKGRRPAFRDLDRVRILADVESDEGQHVPAGSIGIVVARWAHGVAFEVEFAEPLSALATVETPFLEPVERAAD